MGRCTWILVFSFCMPAAVAFAQPHPAANDDRAFTVEVRLELWGPSGLHQAPESVSQSLAIRANDREVISDTLRSSENVRSSLDKVIAATPSIGKEPVVFLMNAIHGSVDDGRMSQGGYIRIDFQFDPRVPRELGQRFVYDYAQAMVPKFKEVAQRLLDRQRLLLLERMKSQNDLIMLVEEQVLDVSKSDRSEAIKAAQFQMCQARLDLASAIKGLLEAALMQNSITSEAMRTQEAHVSWPRIRDTADLVAGE